jgi:4-amino-4-deoxy-L-arabinose transferase-like glycosyltransferase
VQLAPGSGGEISQQLVCCQLQSFSVRRSILPVVLLAALSFFAALGRGPISDSDEAFYAEASREMVESGDWLTPFYNYEPRFQKPVLYYWLTAATFLLVGPSEFAARFWSALAGVGLVAITALCAGRWRDDDDVGLLAGAIAATAFGYFALARMALPDLPLAFFITLTVWAAFVATLERVRTPRPWLLLAAAAAALGFLMKGPLAIVIPALVVVPVLLIERRSFNLRLADVVLSAALFLLIAAPWYVAMWMQHGNAYLESFFIADNFERFATDRFNDPRPWWFYLPVAAGGLLPWTPVTLIWFGPLVQFALRRRDVSTIDFRLLVWTIVPLIFFTWSVGKQPRYILPLLPPLAMLLAGSIVERTRNWRSLDGTRVRPRPNRTVVAGATLAGAFLVLVAVLLYRARVLFLNVSPEVGAVVAAIIAAAGVSVMVVSLTRAWRVAPGALAVAAAVCFAALPYATLAAPSDSTVKQLADRVRALKSPDEAVGTYGVFVRNLIFYSHVKQTDIIHDEHLMDWLAATPKALLVLPTAEADRLQREHSVRFERLATFRYFDDGRLRVGTLLWPDPTTQQDEVALVRVVR